MTPSTTLLSSWEQLHQASRIAILGFGREGKSTYAYLRAHCPQAHLVIADEDPTVDGTGLEATVYTGPQAFADLPGCDVIMKTPGIPATRPEIVRLAQAGAYLTSQTDVVVSRFADRCIGITGTKGKSTTAHVIAALLGGLGTKVVLVGNIGVPVFDKIDSLDAQTLFVYEMSCYQCEGLHRSPHWAVIQAIYQDHLDYYGTMDAYIAAKAKITQYQTAGDVLIYRKDNVATAGIAAQSKAAAYSIAMDDASATISIQADTLMYEGQPIINASALRIPGEHNLLNIAPAIILAIQFGYDRAQIASVLSTIPPLPGRLEAIATVKGVTYYDDAVATIPEATIAALASIPAATLIVGGQDRGQAFTSLGKAIAASGVRTLITFPPTGTAIAAAAKEAGAQVTVYPVSSMQEAVQTAAATTPTGSAVLLSTASPSYGLFTDYAQRSAQYRQCIDALHQ